MAKDNILNTATTPTARFKQAVLVTVPPQCAPCRNFSNGLYGMTCHQCSRYWADLFDPLYAAPERSESELDRMATDAIAGKGLNLPSDQWLEETIEARLRASSE
jgi:hypothetical protein